MTPPGPTAQGAVHLRVCGAPSCWIGRGQLQNDGDHRRFISGRAECTPASSMPRPETGTSPDGRSALRPLPLPHLRDRPISGRAECTSSPPAPPSTRSAHLRACGVNGRAAVTITQWCGTSPGVRSTHCGPSPPIGGFRHISGRAEGTWRRRRRACRPSVHLRACGVHTDQPGCGKRRLGTSPGVRSARRRGAAAGLAFRYISGRAECTLADLWCREAFATSWW